MSVRSKNSSDYLTIKKNKHLNNIFISKEMKNQIQKRKINVILNTICQDECDDDLPLSWYNIPHPCETMCAIQRKKLHDTLLTDDNCNVCCLDAIIDDPCDTKPILHVTPRMTIAVPSWKQKMCKTPQIKDDPEKVTVDVKDFFENMNDFVRFKVSNIGFNEKSNSVYHGKLPTEYVNTDLVNVIFTKDKYIVSMNNKIYNQ